MAAVKVVLWTYRSNKDGTYPIMFRKVINQKPIYIASGYSVKKNQWNKGKVKDHPNAKYLNIFIETKLAEYNDGILKAQIQGTSITQKLVKTIFKTGNEPVDFFAYCQNLIEEFKKNDKYNTAKVYNTVVEKVRAYFDTDTLSFQDITPGHIEKLTDTMQGLSKATINKNLETLKNIFNRAIKDKLISKDVNPFEEIKITRAKKKVFNFLKIEEIEKIEKVKLTVPNDILARDCFLFAFYAAGMRRSDIILLKWDNIVKDRLIYTMYKTDKEMDFRLPAKALKILERYNGKSEYVFPLMDKYRKEKIRLDVKIDMAGSILNKYIKQVAKKAGIEKNVSMHTARFSFSEYALSKTKDFSGTSSMMHENEKTTKDFYISKNDREKADKFMKEVFD